MKILRCYEININVYLMETFSLRARICNSSAENMAYLATRAMFLVLLNAFLQILVKCTNFVPFEINRLMYFPVTKSPNVILNYDSHFYFTAIQVSFSGQFFASYALIWQRIGTSQHIKWQQSTGSRVTAIHNVERI